MREQSRSSAKNGGYAVEDVLEDALFIAWELGYDEGSNEIVW